MDREQAIKILDDLRSYDHDKIYDLYQNKPKSLTDALGLAIEALAIPSAEPRYCDRNICLRNEYNGIGCDECEVTKSQEPKTGHWIEHPTEEDYSVCSRCGIGSRRMEHGKNADGTKYIDIYSYRFCPYCGARMLEPQESEE